MAKKYVITDKETDRILALCKQLGTVEGNGYWHSILNDTAYPNTTCYAYCADGKIQEVASGSTTIGEPLDIPSGVKVEQYCYTVEDGFYENPDYEE